LRRGKTNTGGILLFCICKTAMTKAADPVSRVITLGIPLSMLAIVATMSLGGAVMVATGETMPRWIWFSRWLSSENGAVELATFFLLLTALGLALAAARLAWRAGLPLLTIWLVLHALGVTYFAGEEVSWGQWLLRWETPEWFAVRNDQGETNLHNMSSWLDQKPRLAVFLWIFLAGVGGPLVVRFRGGFPTGSFVDWVLPGQASFLVAILAATARVPEYLANLMGLPVDSALRFVLQPVNLTEVQEFMYAGFFLIYLLALKRRLGGAGR